MNAAYPLPLEAVYYRQLGNIPICGRFDYGSQDVSQFAHYNPCVYLTATPLQVVINAIQLYNRRLFAIVQHIYIYRYLFFKAKTVFRWRRSNPRCFTHHIALRH